MSRIYHVYHIILSKLFSLDKAQPLTHVLYAHFMKILFFNALENTVFSKDLLIIVIIFDS